MVGAPSRQPSGYSLERVYLSHMSFVGIPESDALRDGESPVAFSIDWEVRDGGSSFRVQLGATVEPCRSRPERIGVTMNGVFKCIGDIRSVPVLDFVRYNATALLMPFIREAVASVTSRGLFGVLLMPPFNVMELMRNLDLSGTTGMKQVVADANLAKRIGLR